MRDDEGSEFASPEAAAEGAARSAAEIGIGRLAKSDFSDGVDNGRLACPTASASFLERVSAEPAHQTWRQAAARISSAGPKNS